MRSQKYMDNQKLDVEEILGNEAVTTENENEKQEIIFQDDDSSAKNTIRESYEDNAYVYIHSGKAMTERELLSFSARNRINMVMVAGPFASGKTTLMVMMYYLFKERLNKKIRFKSSYTMKGYMDRSEKLLLNSGKDKPELDRTSTAATDLFLNLNLVDEDNQLRNMVFADLSGEMFQNPLFLKCLPDYFVDSKNILLILDGKKMGNIEARRSAFHEITVMMDNLINYRFVTKNTNLQVICTKMDWVDRQWDNIELEHYIDTKYENFKMRYEKYVADMKFYKISVLNLDKCEESEYLEQIIMNCFEESYTYNEIIEKQEIKINRAFEGFGLRE